MVARGRVEKTVDFVEILRLSGCEVIPRPQQRGAFSASRIRDGAFGSEGLVSLNMKWSEQNGMT
jgi:hypothetical protein